MGGTGTYLSYHYLDIVPCFNRMNIVYAAPLARLITGRISWDGHPTLRVQPDNKNQLAQHLWAVLWIRIRIQIRIQWGPWI